MAYEVDLIVRTVLWAELVKVVSVLCDSMNGVASSAAGEPVHHGESLCLGRTS